MSKTIDTQEDFITTFGSPVGTPNTFAWPPPAGFPPGQLNIFAASSASGKSFIMGSTLQNALDNFPTYYTSYNKKKREKYPYEVTTNASLPELHGWMLQHGISNNRWFLWKRVGQTYYYRFKRPKEAAMFKLVWGGDGNEN